MDIESLSQNEIVKTSPEATSVEFRDAVPAQETIAILSEKKAAYDTELGALAASKETTASQLAVVRQKLGLPPLKEAPPSLQHIEDKMQQIEEEKKKLEEKHAELLSEDQEKLLVEAEKTRLMNEKVSQLREELSKLDDAVKTSIITTGVVPHGIIFQALADVAPNSEEMRQWFALAASEKEVLTSKDIENNDTVEQLSKKVAKEAAANIETAIDHFQERADEGLTETDSEVLKEIDELLIGYEGDSYTPSSLLERIEEQNKAQQLENTDISAVKEAATTYDPNIQAN